MKHFKVDFFYLRQPKTTLRDLAIIKLGNLA